MRDNQSKLSGCILAGLSVFVLPHSDDFVFSGNSFYNSAINDEPMNEGSEPVNMGNGNVAFPDGWTEQQAAEWRRANNAPGAEWPGYRQ